MLRVLSVFLLFCISTQTALASTGDEGLMYLTILFLHQVLFVFWLGPDIGIYMWSTKATNAECTPAQRVSAARMMQTIDIIPKVCMSLMLTVGGILTELMGIEHPWWQMAGIYLLGPVWLSLTLLVFLRQGTESAPQIQRMDNLFRWVLIAGILASTAFSVITGRLAEYPWVTAKLLIFAALIFFGLMMRARLAPFSEAMEALEKDGPSDAGNLGMAKSVARARVYIFASWIALAMAAGLGMVQPGTPTTTETDLAASKVQTN